ncbi:MAG: sugar phosphate nucleotidyltransferase [Candidatus Margulisbacteria bacterium]|nr:sugar phosphate nucleotidyltransferase [Candidatus Margulisiibacteriota bacterium]
MKVVILAGGKGTRLAPYTSVFPKPLMPIGEVPILQLVIERLKKFGLTDITLAVGYLAELMESFFGDGSKFGVKIKYSREKQPLGTAGPLKLIDDLGGGPFLVMNGDILTTLDFGELIDAHKKNKASATIATHQRTVDIDFGVIKSDPRGRLLEYIEKPQHDYRVSMGINIFEPEVLSFFERGDKIDVPDLISLLVKKEKTVNCYMFDGYWLDIGRHSDYEKAMLEFDQMKDKF